MIDNFMDSPEKMAAYLTDNVVLQRYYERFLTIKDDAELKNWETQFWQEVAILPQNEQEYIRHAHAKVPQRIHDRMSGIIAITQKHRRSVSVATY